MDEPVSSLPRPLQVLAERYAVMTGYWAFDGSRRHVSQETVVRVLSAVGVDASTPELVDAALTNAEDEVWRAMLPPVLVVRAGSTSQVWVHLAEGAEVGVRVELDAGGGARTLKQMDGSHSQRSVDGRSVARATFELPADLPLGWHTLVAESGEDSAVCPVAVTPDRLELGHGLEERRGWGFMAQLYSVRSRRSWGVGDLADLRDCAWLAARRCGADFLLVNPLNAAEPIPPLTASPYLPSTRRFVNPLYLRVEEIPETAYLPAQDRTLVEWQAEVAQPLSVDPGPIDRDTAWTAKRVALEVVFAGGRSPARQAAFEAFRAEQGSELEDFATWCALVELHGSTKLPPELADRGSAEVASMQEVLAERVSFHCWLQWVADEQAAAAQRAAIAGGMRVGVVHDLAVGSHPEGADAWAMPDLPAKAMSVGAPPDMYNQQGQNWTQPPWRPDSLVRAGYQPFRDLLRAVLRNAGGIRVDHVIGLFRLWWIPDGLEPTEGAYVRYDHEALVGILCLEAHLSGALVIGEDLGTLEPWVRDFLAERGILGTSVIWFEQQGDGFRPPEDYRELALATLTTHDLPPTAGYLAGEHVELRERLQLLTEPVEQVRAAAAAERGRLVDLLAERGLVAADPEPTEQQLVEAMHRLLLATPSVLVGISLADAVGERRAQNQPGTDTEYPNWRLPLADSAERLVLVEELFDHPRLQALVAALTP